MTRLCRGALSLVLALAVLAGTAHAEAPAGKPPAKTRVFASEYRSLASKDWKARFPHLQHYEVLGPSTPKNRKGAYNCIAHTLKIANRWVWPGKKMIDFDRLYGSHGYKRMKKLDYRRSGRFDKIVLYGKVTSSGKVICTHGARQRADGTWSSKLGAGPLIRHDSPDEVTGPSYGRAIAVYARPRSTAKTAKTAKKAPRGSTKNRLGE